MMTSDSLENLLRIGLLDAVPFSADLLQKMLSVAQSRLQDAMRADNSMETRFDCAYTAIRAVADAALLRQGYRTSTSKPGHHQTTLQCLVHTLDVDPSTVRILDSLRKQRNLTDYDGELITLSLLKECLDQAQALLTLAKLKLH
jgi:hypothetical protein